MSSLDLKDEPSENIHSRGGTKIKHIVLGVLFLAGAGLAHAGPCPTGTNYYSSDGQQLVTLASLGVMQCYYIAANGSDLNDGESETSGHPWAHLPGMSTCTGNCAAHTPAAGEGYIFRGGDTWNGTSIGITWNWAGTSANPIYIGVDPGWPATGWTRPIWSCGKVACTGSQTGNFIAIQKAYVILDNIELTGLFETSTYHPSFVSAQGIGDIAENLYMHGWGHDSTLVGQASSPAFSSLARGSVLRYNVEDGSDTTDDMMYFTHGATPTAYGNYIRYVQTGIDGCGDNWHDNVVEYGGWPGGGHEDGLYQYAPCYATTVFMYNNIVRHFTWAGAGGDVKFWMSGNNFTTATGYAFNNLIYDNLTGNMVGTGGHFGPKNPTGGCVANDPNPTVDCSYGTWYFFNNTVACGTDAIPASNCQLGDSSNSQGGVKSGAYMNLHLSNNHWISSGMSSALICTQASFVCTDTNSVFQTFAAANGQGYNDTSETLAFSPPPSGKGSTVTVGTNIQTLCATIAAYDSLAGAACQNETTYACEYDATNHVVVCPTRAPIARGAAPNVGAYQFSYTQSSTPAPPKGLTGIVE